MKKPLFLSLILFMYYLSHAQKFDSAYHYKIKNLDAAIFPKEFVRNYDSTSIDKKFTPNLDEILIAYKDLRDSLFNKSNDTIKIKDALGRNHWDYQLEIILKYFNIYKWQFFGHLNTKGEKIVSVISFLDDDRFPADWLHTETQMSDGGCEYWQAEYNLKTHKIILFMCNSPGG